MVVLGLVASMVYVLWAKMLKVEKISKIIAKVNLFIILTFNLTRLAIGNVRRVMFHLFIIVLKPFRFRIIAILITYNQYLSSYI